MEAARPTRSRQHVVVLAACLAALALVLAFGAVLEPDPRGHGTHQQLGFQACFPMERWDVPCPGCGVTTAVVLAVHGRPLASLATQPFGLVVLAALLALAAWALRGHVLGRDLARELERLPLGRIASLLGVLALVAWLYKLALVRG
jgi:hypothetical protein